MKYDPGFKQIREAREEEPHMLTEHEAQINEREFTRVAEKPPERIAERENAYITINEVFRILRAPWSPGSTEVFHSGYAGV